MSQVLPVDEWIREPLKPQSNRPLYSNMVIGTLAVGGLAVTFSTARRGLGGPAHHGQCTNFILFNVAL